MRCSSEMGGGHQTIIKNGGVYTSAAENGGGTHARPKAARKRVPPPLRVFFAPSLNRHFQLKLFNLILYKPCLDKLTAILYVKLVILTRVSTLILNSSF